MTTKPLSLEKFTLDIFRIWSRSPFDDMEIDADDFKKLLLDNGIIFEKALKKSDIERMKRTGHYFDQKEGEIVWAPTPKFEKWFKEAAARYKVKPQ